MIFFDKRIIGEQVAFLDSNDHSPVHESIGLLQGSLQSTF